MSRANPALSEIDYELQLIDDIGRFFDDPLGFVRYVYPWGEAGTPLEDEDGPDVWQAEFLADLGRLVRQAEDEGDVATAIRMAVASGHGIGKTATVAWIIHWFVSTREHPQVVVTANTESQLSTKTWRELAKWHNLSLNRHWFDWHATKFAHRHYPETWFAKAIPWTEQNSQSFAGTHEKHVLVVYDEASTIADTIWEVTDGAMTTPGAMWVAFGNPTENTGRFAECFGRFKHRWNTRHIDARTAKAANRKELDQWVEDHGEDSDFVRVRVRGLFPRAGTSQFIALDRIDAAKARVAAGYQGAARILGVDVARSGACQTVLCRRQGIHLDPFVRVRISDLMEIAALVAWHIREWNPDATFIDAVGMGWGVYDRLQQLGFGDKVIAVQSGERALDGDRYANKRAEMWDNLRAWIVDGGALPANDPELDRELFAPGYRFDRSNRLLIESKEEMLRRGQPSPDSADALALTFAFPVANKRDPEIPAWKRKLLARNRPAGSPMTA